MKNLIILLLLALPGLANAALGSIWNGEKFDVAGYLLVQDAEKKSKFYYMPKQFRLKSRADLTVGNEGEIVATNIQAVSNEVTTLPSGDRYSVYNLKVLLTKMSKQNRNRARMALRREFGSNAKLVGMAPICGIDSQLPNMSHHDPMNTAIGITYSLSSHSAACDQINVPREFSIRVMVPMYFEPAFAKSLISGAGEIFPTIQLFHPYKYTDNVTMKFRAIDMYEYFSAAGGIKGTYKYVSAELRGQMRNMVENFYSSGSLTFDIQNQDPKVREYYHTVFVDMLSRVFFHFLPLSNPTGLPDNLPISYGNSQSIVQASLAMSKDEAERRAEIKLSLKDINYGKMSTQVPVVIPAINRNLLHPEIQEKL